MKSYGFFYIYEQMLSDEIAAKITNHAFFRSSSYNKRSVLTIIFLFNVEVLNMMVTSTALGAMALQAWGPVPLFCAHLLVVLVVTEMVLVFILSCAMSGLKLLFVTHFQLVFLQEKN